MDEVKETSYDFSYFHSNPFVQITEKILTGNCDKVNVETEQVPIVRIKTNQQSIISSIASYSYSFLQSVPLISSFMGSMKDKQEIEILKAKQANAISYEEWLEISIELDLLLGNSIWKDELESNLYNYRLLQDQLNELKECRLIGDYNKILYIIRTSWTRHFAGINNEELYKHSFVGTKTLIKQYFEECELCLAELASPECPLEDEYILTTLSETRKNYGQVGITMSGGGTFGLIGIGVFSTMLELDVFPKIVSGSSCGSIVSAIMCSKTSNEIMAVLNSLFDKKFEVFGVDEYPDTFYSHLSRLLKYGIWFDSKYLQNTMKIFLGNITFREAFNKTGRILNVTVSPASVHDQPTLLNYLTAPNVLVWSAVCASCSLPLVFPSSTIYEKNIETGEIQEFSNPMLKFVDGSLNSDLPITRLSEMFNVNHVIACQVNPHITPLIRFANECLDNHNTGGMMMLKRSFYKFFQFASMEMIHYLDILSELGISENLCTKLKQMLKQSYIGDITILPDVRLSEIGKVLANPTPDFIWECVLKGARATWPKISIIRDQSSIEIALDKYIGVIKSRFVFGSKDMENTIPKDSKSCETSPLKASVGKKGRKSLKLDLANPRSRAETVTISEKLRHAGTYDESPFGSKIYPDYPADSTTTNGYFPNNIRKRISFGSLSEQKKTENQEELAQRATMSTVSLRSMYIPYSAKERHNRSYSYTESPSKSSIQKFSFAQSLNIQPQEAEHGVNSSPDSDEILYSTTTCSYGYRRNSSMLSGFYDNSPVINTDILQDENEDYGKLHSVKSKQS